MIKLRYGEDPVGTTTWGHSRFNNLVENVQLANRFCNYCSDKCGVIGTIASAALVGAVAYAAIVYGGGDSSRDCFEWCTQISENVKVCECGLPLFTWLMK